MADLKLGGPRNYNQDSDSKKLGLDKAAAAINKNTGDISSLDTRVTALEETNPEIPAHTSADAGKFLGVDSEGALAFDYAPDDELPAYSSADAGKFLGVDSQGELAFENIVIPETGIGAEVIAEVYVDAPPGSPYSQGDVVTYNGNFYECLASGTTNPPVSISDWAPITLTSVGEWGGNVPADGYVFTNSTLYHNKTNQSQYFSPSSPSTQFFEVVNYTEWQATPPSVSYSAGDYAMYNDELYICTGSTSGPFDRSRWTKINVMSQITPVDASRLCPVPNPLTDDRKVVTYDNTEDCYILTKPAGITFPNPNFTQPKLRIGTTTDGSPVFIKRMVFQNGAPITADCETGYEFLGLIAINSFVKGNGNDIYHPYDPTAGATKFDITITNDNTRINVLPTTSITNFTIFADVVWAEVESM